MIFTNALLLTLICGLASAGRPYSSMYSRSSHRAGAVYAMTNDRTKNEIVAFSRDPNGILTPMDTYPTGGTGNSVDLGNGIEPLFSIFSVILTPDNRFLLAVNAGSRSITAFRVQRDFSLRRTSVAKVSGFGPLSIAYSKGLVYVASLDADGEFDAVKTMIGSLTGFRLTAGGRLVRIRGSVRTLPERPSGISFTPDGKSLVISQVFSGNFKLGRKKVEELVVYSVGRKGLLSKNPVATLASTGFNDPNGRNLPTTVGFNIERVGGKQFIVATEAREITPTGEEGLFQTASISTWEIDGRSRTKPAALDVLIGSSVAITDGQCCTAWIEFAKRGPAFWVTNTFNSTTSAFELGRDGTPKLVKEVAFEGAPDLFPIDMWVSRDGMYMYQLQGDSGEIFGFRVARGGRGPGITRIQTIGGLPDVNPQGLVAI